MSTKKNQEWKSIGRRKSSVARIVISNGKGIYTINRRNISNSENYMKINLLKNFRK